MSNAFDRLIASCRRGDRVALHAAERLLLDLDGPERDALLDAVAEGLREAQQAERSR